MIRNKRTIETYIDKLKTGEHFTFVKYGDGEFGTIFSPGGKNQENCKYYPEIGDKMKASILHQYKENFIYAFGGISNRIYKKQLDIFFKENNLLDMEWGNADDFHHASIAGKLKLLFNQLNKMKVIIVGPKNLNVPRLKKHINYCNFIEVPRRDAGLTFDITSNIIISSINIHHPDVIIFCAGFATNLICDKLWPEYKNKVTMIDLGSALDPAIGDLSRGYMRKPKHINHVKSNFK